MSTYSESTLGGYLEQSGLERLGRNLLRGNGSNSRPFLYLAKDNLCGLTQVGCRSSPLGQKVTSLNIERLGVERQKVGDFSSNVGRGLIDVQSVSGRNLLV